MKDITKHPKHTLGTESSKVQKYSYYFTCKLLCEHFVEKWYINTAGRLTKVFLIKLQSDNRLLHGTHVGGHSRILGWQQKSTLRLPYQMVFSDGPLEYILSVYTHRRICSPRYSRWSTISAAFISKWIFLPSSLVRYDILKPIRGAKSLGLILCFLSSSSLAFYDRKQHLTWYIYYVHRISHEPTVHLRHFQLSTRNCTPT